MANALTALESLPWSNLQIPLGYQRAAARMDALVPDGPLDAFARGFHENNECLVALTRDAIVFCAARAFTVDDQRWDLDEAQAVFRDDDARRVVELTAPGRLAVLRLIREPASDEFVARLDARLHPRPEITFRPYLAHP